MVLKVVKKRRRYRDFQNKEVLIFLLAILMLASMSALNPMDNFLLLILPVILIVLHACWTLGYRRGSFFLLLIAFIGLVMEVMGVNYGSSFGIHYVYQMKGLMIKGVPLWVPLYWAVFIYTGYNLVTSCLFWINQNKPDVKKKNIELIPLLIFLDGLVVVAIDVFMDPLQVKAGSWLWLKSGPYFGVPLENFLAWFLVTIISTGPFRIFEYFSPQEPPKIDQSIFLMPVIGYGLLCLSFASWALKLQLPELVLIGSLAMLPVVMVNLLLFINWKKEKK